MVDCKRRRSQENDKRSQENDKRSTENDRRSQENDKGSSQEPEPKKLKLSFESPVTKVTKRQLAAPVFCEAVLSQVCADMLDLKGLRNTKTGKLWTQKQTQDLFAADTDVSLEHEIPTCEGFVDCGIFKLTGRDGDKLEQYEFHVAMDISSSVAAAVVCVRGHAQWYNGHWLRFDVSEYRVDIKGDGENDKYRRLAGSKKMQYPGGYDFAGLRFPMSANYFTNTAEQPDIEPHFDVAIIEDDL